MPSCSCYLRAYGQCGIARTAIIQGTLCPAALGPPAKQVLEVSEFGALEVWRSAPSLGEQLLDGSAFEGVAQQLLEALAGDEATTILAFKRSTAASAFQTAAMSSGSLGLQPCVDIKASESRSKQLVMPESCSSLPRIRKARCHAAAGMHGNARRDHRREELAVVHLRC